MTEGKKVHPRRRKRHRRGRKKKHPQVTEAGLPLAAVVEAHREVNTFQSLRTRLSRINPNG